LSYQANWELVFKLVRIYPGKMKRDLLLLYIYFFIPQFKYMNFIYS